MLVGLTQIRSFWFAQCNVDETLALQTAGLMKSLGLIVRAHVFANNDILRPWQDVGYKHFNLDDCWAEKNRSAEGLLVPGENQLYILHAARSS